jgi:rod shape determining protein RodA
VKRWTNFDWLLLVVPLALSALSVVMLWKISQWAPEVPSNTPVKQIAFLACGLLLFGVLTSFDYRRIGWTIWIAYGLSVASLVAVAVIGHSSHGAQRWISFGGLQVEPSEPTKLILILTLAHFYARREDRVGGVRTLLMSIAIVAVPAVIVLQQPDLGTALVLGAVWLTITAMASTPVAYLGALGTLAAGVTPVVWLKVLKPFQRDRLTSFLQPQKSPLGSGWNIIHAQIAVGSGGPFGEWFRKRTVSRLDFLRIQDRDFIFSVIAEQVGYFCLMILLALYVCMFLRIARVAYRSADPLGRLIASGVLAMFLFQAFVNIGMNIGIMPVTGIPLPLISYGGSSLVTSFAALGFLESILLRYQKLVFAGRHGRV